MKIKNIQDCYLKDKRGVSAAPLMVVVVLAVIVLIGVMIFSFAQPQTQLTQPGVSPTAVPSSKTVCNVEPYLAPSISDAVTPGTSIAQLDYTVSQVDDTGAVISQFGNQTLDSGGKKFNVGDKLEIIVDKSNYISKKVAYTVGSCGANQFAVSIYATDVSTLQVYNSDQNLVSDNSLGGATNQTNSSTLITMDGLKITAPAKKTSGDLVIAIETNNDTEVKDIVLVGATKLQSIPKFKKVEGTGSDSLTVWYEVPAVLNGASNKYGISIEPESGKVIGAGNQGNSIFITAYSKEWFADVDGTFKYGIEDSDGVVQYEDTFDFDFAFGR